MSKHRHRPVDRLADARAAVDSVPCESVPHIFFPEDIQAGSQRKQAIQMAKRLCSECPIQMACFEYALAAKERHGIWGGTLPSDR